MVHAGDVLARIDAEFETKKDEIRAAYEAWLRQPHEHFRKTLREYNGGKPANARAGFFGLEGAGQMVGILCHFGIVLTTSTNHGGTVAGFGYPSVARKNLVDRKRIMTEQGDRAYPEKHASSAMC